MSAKVERKEVDKSQLKGTPIIWIMGGPGSGKGTQCENVQVKFAYEHISSGDVLRADVMSGSTRGQQLYKLMSSGQKVPDQIVDDLLAETMVAKVAKAKGFLIDGFPLDLKQAAAFEADIAAPVAIIYLEANDDILKERLLSRNNFDDTEESIANRLSTFNETTKPVLEKYKDKVKSVNAERSKDEIFADVKTIMESL